MKNKLAAESHSSFFVSTLALIIWLGASVGANLIGYGALSIFLMFIFLLCLTSKIWGKMAIKNVSVSLEAQSKRLFQGEKTELTYKITNNKFMPLIWLEIIQTLPKTKCLWPENAHDVYEVEHPLEIYLPTELISKKKFSFILWHQTLSWRTVWNAKKRGLYQVKNLRLVSGDGLGLVQNSITHTPEPLPVFMVYPKIVPVNIELFLQSFSNLSSSTRGYMDDQTVIKGIREYQPLDSWKNINWRVTAREHKLQVNMFETILPKSAHFIIDGESFQDISPDFAEMEDSLSVIASVILQLQEEKIKSGLSLPRSMDMPAINILPSKGAEVDDVMYYLSAYQCTPRIYDPEKIYLSKQAPEQSEFDEQEMNFSEGNMGKVFYVIYSVEKIKHWELLEKIGRTNVTIITSVEPKTAEVPEALDYKIVTTESLKRR